MIIFEEDGKISRMSLLDTDAAEEQELGITMDDGRASGLSTPDIDNGGVDIRLRLVVMGSWT